ncbi:MAG: tetratricopeptide repeat protein [Bdellovibrionales bacterium]|nr:tetratricopeptide repeat protein [Bdellovibrionales bacterium]
MKVLKLQSLLILLIFSPLSLMASIPNGPVDKDVHIGIERVGDMTHFEFRGRKNWEYTLGKEGDVVELIVPRLGSKDIESLQSYSGLLVKKITVDDSVENKTKIKMELADEFVENFDYLTQEPSHLVIDFFVSEEGLRKRLQQQRVAAAKKKKVQKQKKNDSEIFADLSKSKRNPAFAEFLFANGEPAPNGKAPGATHQELPLSPLAPVEELFDFGALTSSAEDSLEAKVIEAQGNIYLRFPPLKLENRHLTELERFKPEYEITPSFSDENKQARFLLALYEQRSYASFIKAKQLFKKTFPESKYDEILNYAEADIWVELWKKNKAKQYITKAMTIYRMMVERHPNSKLTERTLIYMGLLANETEQYFLATKMLQRYLKKYPNSPFVNYAKIYMADSLIHLNNYEGARQYFDEAIASGDEGSAMEAEFRRGDVYYHSQTYRRAERSYKEAIDKYPLYAHNYPNAYFNMAAAQFNLAEYPESLETFKKFFDTYPTHEYSAYALTRIGEIIDILLKDRRRAQGFYNEAYYRFRNSTGGVIARVRSLSQRFADMKPKELKTAIQEIQEKGRKIDLSQVDEFVAFMISDGYYSRGDYLKAAEALIKYFQVNPKPVNIQKFEKRISRAIAGEIKQLISQGKVVDAISIIESHQKSWLSKSRRVDVQMFRAIAYEKMGLFDQAFDSYDRLYKRMTLLKGSKEEKERKIFEYYPSFDKVRLRQAVSAYGKGDIKLAHSLIKEVKNVDKLQPDMKADYFWTVAKLSYDAKVYDKALEVGLKVDESQISDPQDKEKFNIFLSQLYEKNKMFDKAISILEDYYKKNKKEREQVYVLSRLFHLYKDKGMPKKAIETGQLLLNEYDGKYDLDRERYYLGDLQYQSNDLKAAAKTWKDITKKTMWSDLAKNRVGSDEWREKTKESMKRIPAMAR